MTNANEMMMDLFRAEVESHSESLTSALLKLEQNSSATELIDGMMRSAHSVKGAARIVQVDAAVQVSHVMEDCFVAAQRGEIVLVPSSIDVMLKSVDMLSRISEESRKPAPNWGALQPTIDELVRLLKQVHAGQVLQDTAVTIPSQSPKVVKDERSQVVATAATKESVPSELPQPSNIKESASTTVRFPEHLNASSAETVRQELANLLQAKPRQIELDLSATRDLDAVGLALLDAIASYAENNSDVAIAISKISAPIETVIKCLETKALWRRGL